MGGSHALMDVEGGERRLLTALDGRIKLVLLVAALLLNLSSAGPRLPLLLLAVALLLTLAAGVRLAVFARRMTVPAVLALVALLTQLFWVEQGAELLRVPIFSWQWVVTDAGVSRGLELAARIVGGMGVLLFFALSTPLPELMRAARAFRCPPVLVELALIMYRYIFLLLEEGARIRIAQKSRLGYVDSRTALRSSAVLGGMLILRTFDRAERSFAAMRSRGYQGVLLVAPRPLLRRDWQALAVGLLLLATLFALR